MHQVSGSISLPSRGSFRLFDDALVQPGDGIGDHDGFGGSTCCLRLLVDGDGAVAGQVLDMVSFVLAYKQWERPCGVTAYLLYNGSTTYIQ